MQSRFIKLERVDVEGYDPNNPTATVDVLLNVEHIAQVLTDAGADKAVVLTRDGQRIMVSDEQAERIDAIALGRTE
jgi:hypothetical protein